MARAVKWRGWALAYQLCRTGMLLVLFDLGILAGVLGAYAYLGHMDSTAAHLHLAEMLTWHLLASGALFVAGRYAGYRADKAQHRHVISARLEGLRP